MSREQEKALHKIIQRLNIAPHEMDALELEVSAAFGDPNEAEKEAE